MSAKRATSPRPISPELDGVFLNDNRNLAPKLIDPALPPHIFRVERSARSRRHPPPHKEESDLPDPGAIIDKYRIDQILGIGGFAAVYQATHLMLNMKVAIKMLRPRVIKRHPEMASKLCEEAGFIARVMHPNVVRVHDVTHTETITYVVMEYIDGETLAQSIKLQRRLGPERVLRIGADVASGLRAALAQRLIHRDIKPANILIERATGLAKIVDLGLAQRDPGGNPAWSSSPAGAIIGTPGYMAPEQGRTPNRVDFRADIYSLGVTLYHAAVGEPPFPTEDPQVCMDLHRSAPPPPPERRVAGFPLVLSALLLRMMAKTPEERHSSYDSLLSAIEKARVTLSG